MCALRLLEGIRLEDYLEAEKTSPVKHEHIHGRVFALSGTSDVHNRISINLVVGLDGASRRKGCQLYTADLKLSIFGERSNRLVEMPSWALRGKLRKSGV